MHDFFIVPAGPVFFFGSGEYRKCIPVIENPLSAEGENGLNGTIQSNAYLFGY